MFSVRHLYKYVLLKKDEKGHIMFIQDYIRKRDVSPNTVILDASS